jgi:DNA-binding NarL/FixJ family response regulator
MLEIGARGYCNIDIDPVLLKKAVQVVQKGEIWVGRSVISSLVQKLTARRESLHKHSDTDAFDLSSLTPKEREIARMVGSAASNKQIAVGLGISEATVKSHLTDIFRKLRIIDRLELALFVTSHSVRRILTSILIVLSFNVV